MAPGGEGAGSPAALRASTYLGALTEYHLDLGGERLVVISPTPAHSDPRRRLAAGDTVRIDWPAEAARVLSPEPVGDLP